MHLGRVRCGEREFGLVFERRQRRAQLVRGVGQKGLLRERALAHATEEAVDGVHQPVHLGRRARGVDGPQVVERARADLGAEPLQRAQRPAGGQHDGQHTGKCKREHADERAGERLAPHLLALEFGFTNAHLAHRAAACDAACHHPHGRAVDFGLVEGGRVGRQSEARIAQRRVASDLPAIGCQHGVVDAVGLIGTQRALGLRVHVERDRLTLRAHEAGHRDGGIAE